MRYDYDRKTDILTITLSDGAPEYGEQAENIITHYSKDGKPIEIEILEASRTILELIKPILKRERGEAEA